MEEIVLHNRNTDWIVIVMILAGLIVVLARFSDPVRVGNFLRLPVYVKGRELASTFNPIQSKRIVDFLLSLAAILMVALAIYFAKRTINGFYLESAGWQEYLRILFFITVFLLFKTLIGALLGSVFSVIEPIIAAQNQLFAYLSWLLVPLFPVILAGIFIADFQIIAGYITLVVLLLGLLLAFLQSAATIIKLPPSIGYNIFYLCALEITPVVYLVFVIQKI